MIEIHLIHPVGEKNIVNGFDVIYPDEVDFTASGIWYKFEEFEKIIRCFIPFSNIKFYRERTNLTSYKE